MSMDTVTAEKIIAECEEKAKQCFTLLEKTALFNQKKVLNSFRKNRVSDNHFKGSTGYGYDDSGRDCLSRVFADTFQSESAIVSPLIANGTHAITLSLFGILRPFDTLLSITGKPYDTLDAVICGTDNGSLKDYKIEYKQVDLTENGCFDLEKISDALQIKPKAVFIQRSKGYAWRDSLKIEEIAEIVAFVKKISPESVVIVDNCYGEFVDTREPIEAGADVIAGSLIKNPGGGLAPTGGYIAGKKHLIEQISYRLTAPSLGTEVGSYLSGYQYFFQGLFIAPSVVLSALKGAILSGYVFKELSIPTQPRAGVIPTDIITAAKFETADELIRFCQSVQKASPVDSFVSPEPWDMPGYPNKVIMAAGTFIQGASIELTADGTVRSPYVGYLQGGLTYEHYKIALTEIITLIR